MNSLQLNTQILRLPGVYKIICLANGRKYVGSSKDLSARWSAHKSDLRKENHRNKSLQEDFLKYGADAFQFEVVCFTENEVVARLVEHDLLNLPQDLYNVSKSAWQRVAPSPNVSEHNRKLKAGNQYWLGRKHSEESKLKQSLRQRPCACMFISPEGEIFEVQNLQAFCKERNLNNSHMGAVAKGKFKQHKGWRKYEGDRCDVSYADRQGKYQGQGEAIVCARV